MSAKIDHGGFAFPTMDLRAPNGSTLSAGQDGMSLRDWFAGQALIGILGSGEFLSPDGLWTGNGAPVTADAAYLLADAMLKARKGEA